MVDLPDGSALPRILHPPPGPRSRKLCQDLHRFEAPGINTLIDQAPSLLWEEARGANVVDVDGNVYLDLTSGFGVAAVGHRHPRVVTAVTQQANRLLHGLADVAAHPRRVELASRLSSLAPVAGAAGAAGDDVQVYFAVSGADAVEVALKTALLATGKPGIVAFAPCYHGLSLGALSLNSRGAFRQPFVDYLHPHVHRLDYGCPPPALRQLLARAPEVGTLVVEPIVGREGVLVPPVGWLAEIAQICRQHQVLVIADEIFTGFGRTGSLFAVTHERVEPDLLCCGKALGGGLPIAAVLARRSLMAAWRRPGEALHTGTFVAHPLACAAALAVLEVLVEERLEERARLLGAMLGPRLGSWQSPCSAVTAVRGRGLLWGIEFDSRDSALRLSAAAMAQGVLVLAGGPEGRVVELVPPLSITDDQLAVALDVLERNLALL